MDLLFKKFFASSKFIRSVNNENKEELNLVYGVVTIILGILVITNPEAIASFLPIVIGISIIINSANKLQYALELKSRNNSLWKSTCIVSIISTVFGLLLLFNPFEGAQFIAKIVGTLIVIYSVLDIISTLSIRKNINVINKAIEENLVDADIVDESDDTTDTKSKKKKKKKNK